MTKYVRICEIADNDSFDNYIMLESEIYNHDSHSSGKIADNGSLLVFFANLEEQPSFGSKLYQLIACLHVSNEKCTIQSYIDTIYNEISMKFGMSVAEILTIGLKNKADTISLIPDARELVLCDVYLAKKAASLYTSLLRNQTGSIDFLSELKRSLIFNFTDNPFRVLYLPTPAFSKKTKKIVYLDSFAVENISDAMYLYYIFSVKSGNTIKQCGVCNRFFIPHAKSDEIYCSECRKKTYDSKISTDQILSAYRKIYKTQNQRKQRNRHIPNIEHRFSIWKKKADEVKILCQNNVITIEEMEKAISSDSWIRQNRGERSNGHD